MGSALRVMMQNTLWPALKGSTTSAEQKNRSREQLGHVSGGRLEPRSDEMSLHNLPSCSYHHSSGESFDPSLDKTRVGCDEFDQERSEDRTISFSEYIQHSEAADLGPVSLAEVDVIPLQNEDVQHRAAGIGVIDAADKPMHSNKGLPPLWNPALKSSNSRSHQNLQSLLHRSSSEPFAKPIHVKRTQSDLPKIRAVKARVASKRQAGDKSSVLSQPRATRHAEGPSLAKAKHPQRKTESIPAPLEKGEHGAVIANGVPELECEEHAGSEGSDWETESSDDEPLDQKDSDIKVPRLKERLQRYIDYLMGTMQKKMPTEGFVHYKNEFNRKILAYDDVQFGFRDNRYMKVGSGEFGDVLFGRLRSSTSYYVAIKAVRKDKTDEYALLQEAFMLQLASTTGYTPGYFGLAPTSVLGDGYLDWGIVLEFVGDPHTCCPCDFRRTLKESLQHPPSPHQFLTWIYVSAKMAHATKRFHNMGMLVNDIKADNILLRPTYAGHFEPVFIDFGLASFGEGISLALEVTEENKAKILKEYSHIAPEVLFGGETNIKSDMFSLGKALSLISEAFPLDVFSDVVARCNAWNPDERPSCSELMNVLDWLSASLSHR